MWEQVTEFDAGVAGGELPVDLPLVEALPGEPGEFDLGDVEPGAVLGRVVQFQAGGQIAGLGGLERFVERAEGVGVQVVHDEHVTRRVGVVDGQQVVDLVRPVDPGPLAAGVDPASAVEGFDPHEDRAGPVADVLGALLQIVSGAGRDRVAGVPEELVRLLVHTHHRHRRIQPAVVDLQHVLHPGHELAAGVRRDRPALLQMRTKPPF